MRVALTEATDQLDELVRLAESGEDVTITRDGKPIVRLVQLEPKQMTAEERRLLIDELQAQVAAKNLPPIRAEFSQDFLYDEHGLPA